MKDASKKILVMVAAFCLLILLGFLVKDAVVKQSKKTYSPPNLKDVLGQQVEKLKENLKDTSSPINTAMENTLDSAKKEISEKSVEIQRNAVIYLENEVRDFTKAQSDHIKYRICQDWGVITGAPAPSATISPIPATTTP